MSSSKSKLQGAKNKGHADVHSGGWADTGAATEEGTWEKVRKGALLGQQTSHGDTEAHHAQLPGALTISDSRTGPTGLTSSSTPPE